MQITAGVHLGVGCYIYNFALIVIISYFLTSLEGSKVIFLEKKNNIRQMVLIENRYFSQRDGHVCRLCFNWIKIYLSASP